MCVTFLETIMPLNQETIVRTLFAARTRLSAAVWLVVRDAQAAEDIFQNVSVKALTKNVVFEHEGQLLSWAHVTARHEAIDWLRRQRRNVVALDAGVLELLEAEWAAASGPPSSARVDALRDCLDATPAEGRRLLELRYFEGCSCEEAARAVGLGLDAVYQRLSRLHRALKLCVERRLSGDAAFTPSTL